MKIYPFISVIIPVFNRPSQLDKCIDSLCGQSYPKEKIEILVVDDGSTAPLNQNSFPSQVRLIRQEHLGDTAARNLGAAYAKGDFLFFTDSDCVIAPDTLVRLYEAMEEKGAAAARGAYRNKSRRLVARFVQMDFEYRQAMLANSRAVDLLDTACTLIRRDVFFSVGGFNPSIRVCGDVAISYELSQKGYKLLFAPEAVVYHQHSDNILAYLRNKCRKGIWRSRVFRLYPNKLMRDSYTPQSLKLQCMSAMALIFLSLSIPILSHKELILYALLISTISFLLSSAPFMVFAFRRDRTIGALSFFFLFVRALSLMYGFIFSLFDFSWKKDEKQTP